jgi:uncharacterized protein (DUF111 family)
LVKHSGTPDLTFSPITAEILCSASVPVYGSYQHSELVTPVAAALVATLASRVGPLPAMTIKGIGYGKDQSRQTRIFIGERAAQAAGAYKDQTRPARHEPALQAQAEDPSHSMASAQVMAQDTDKVAVKSAQAATGYLAAVEEWVALSIKGHQQSGRQRA